MRKWIGILVVLVFSGNSYSQNLKVFEDELGMKGEYRFSGTYSDTVLPKKGSVDIRWREINDNRLKTYRIKGQTQDHLPVGKWSWEEAEWDYRVNVGQGISPSFNAKGERMKWEGNFIAGQPEGRWNFTLDSISGNGRSFGSLIRIDLLFKKGKPAGAISLDDNVSKNRLKLKGTCDAEGISTGVWTYLYRNENGIQVREERVYKQGLLIEIRTTEGNVKSVVKFDNNIRFVEREKGATFVEGMKVGDLQFEQDEYGGIASELYHENFSQYFQQGWKLEVFPFEFARFLPSFKRLEYPLNQHEIDDLSDSRQLISKQRDTIRQLLSGNIYIHRSRSGELDTTISFLQLQLSRLNYIDSLLDRTELPFFTYKNRYGQDTQHWIEGLNQMRQSKGEVYDSLSIELPFIDIMTDSIYIFREFKNILTGNEAVFPVYYQTVEDAHISVKREGELKELEDKIVERFKEQQLFYEEKEGVGSLINTKWVKGEIQTLIQEYARTDEYEEALRIGHDVMVKLDSLENWQDKIEHFDKMAEILKAKYTYLAYNPYTGENDIEITNKKRFLNAILTNLWPFMLDEIGQENEWDKWTGLWERQFKVFNYLMLFSSKDDKQAKRIDKRVRKEKKPERILRIIIQQLENTGNNK